MAKRRAVVEVEASELDEGVIVLGDELDPDGDLGRRVLATPDIRTIDLSPGASNASHVDLVVSDALPAPEACEVIARWVDERYPGSRHGPVTKSSL